MIEEGCRVRIVFLMKTDTKETNLQVGSIGTVIHVWERPEGRENVITVYFDDKDLIPDEALNSDEEGGYLMFESQLERI